MPLNAQKRVICEGSRKAATKIVAQLKAAEWPMLVTSHTAETASAVPAMPPSTRVYVVRTSGTMSTSVMADVHTARMLADSMPIHSPAVADSA